MEAMGLVEAEDVIESLDLDAVRKMVGRAAEAGIGEAAAVALEAGRTPGPKEVEELLGVLRRALEESPAPEREWRALVELFGVEQLARLVGVSVASLRRYASGERPTPDRVAERLHFIARVAADLRGAYSEVGVRRWFERKRAQLAGRAPSDILRRDWDPEDRGPREVLELARSLAGAPAT